MKYKKKKRHNVLLLRKGVVKKISSSEELHEGEALSGGAIYHSTKTMEGLCDLGLFSSHGPAEKEKHKICHLPRMKPEADLPLCDAQKEGD